MPAQENGREKAPGTLLTCAIPTRLRGNRGHDQRHLACGKPLRGNESVNRGLGCARLPHVERESKRRKQPRRKKR